MRKLLEAKWSPSTVAAHWLLEEVFVTRLDDQFQDGGRLEKAGNLAGAEWSLAAEALKKKYLEVATFDWVRRELSIYFRKIEQQLAEASEVDARFEWLNDFHDGLDGEAVTPIVSRLLDEVHLTLQETLALSSTEGLEPSIALFASKWISLYSEMTSSFRHDEFSTPLGTLQLSHFFPKWRSGI